MTTVALSLDHLAPWTRYCRLASLRRMLAYLHACGAPNLVAHVPRTPVPAPRAVTVTQAERDKCLNAAPLYLRCWLLLCADLALRSGTAAAIAPANYDPEKQEITFRTKQDVAQTLPVTDELARIFAALPSTADPTVPYVGHLSSRGHITVNELRHNFWRLRKSLGIARRIIPHDLRRTAAVRTLTVSADLRLVQALLGHRSLKSTLHYLDHRNTPVPKELLERIKKGVQ